MEYGKSIHTTICVPEIKSQFWPNQNQPNMAPPSGTTSVYLLSPALDGAVLRVN